MDSIVLERQKVYDPLLRILHWGIALSIIVLSLTGLGEDIFEKAIGEKTLWQVHIAAGYGLLASFSGRVLWGFVGPRHARFSEIWQPGAWLAAARRSGDRASRKFGHDPKASIAYLSFFALVAVMIGTGFPLAGIEHGVGPLAPWLFDKVQLEELFEEPHEVLAWGIVAFVVLHIGGMIRHERKGKAPIAQSMISGYQYRVAQSEDERVPHE